MEIGIDDRWDQIVSPFYRASFFRGGRGVGEPEREEVLSRKIYPGSNLESRVLTSKVSQPDSLSERGVLQRIFDVFLSCLKSLALFFVRCFQCGSQLTAPISIVKPVAEGIAPPENPREREVEVKRELRAELPLIEASKPDQSADIDVEFERGFSPVDPVKPDEDCQQIENLEPIVRPVEEIEMSPAQSTPGAIPVELSLVDLVNPDEDCQQIKNLEPIVRPVEEIEMSPAQSTPGAIPVELSPVDFVNPDEDCQQIKNLEPIVRPVEEIEMSPAQSTPGAIPVELSPVDFVNPDEDCQQIKNLEPIVRPVEEIEMSPAQSAPGAIPVELNPVDPVKPVEVCPVEEVRVDLEERPTTIPTKPTPAEAPQPPPVQFVQAGVITTGPAGNKKGGASNHSGSFQQTSLRTMQSAKN